MAVLALVFLISVDTFVSGMLLVRVRNLERTVGGLGRVVRDVSGDARDE